ncbi:hypothetical protein Mgrana_02358 [Meiothermus granaticius NBRC 107808]|uniref:Uncharacterized protein n=1 Tax=Meiothermus granaticius NBRC 107808 TaxID=1227551 RepID=A0A399FAU8_9DEIN|nr:hypothetical protein Mgrana_02358 [Meiothermus granaticius NBRC 107808]
MAQAQKTIPGLACVHPARCGPVPGGQVQAVDHLWGYLEGVGAGGQIADGGKGAGGVPGAPVGQELEVIGATAGPGDLQGGGAAGRGRGLRGRAGGDRGDRQQVGLEGHRGVGAIQGQAAAPGLVALGAHPQGVVAGGQGLGHPQPGGASQGHRAVRRDRRGDLHAGIGRGEGQGQTIGHTSS